MLMQQILQKKKTDVIFKTRPKGYPNSLISKQLTRVKAAQQKHKTKGEEIKEESETSESSESSEDSKDIDSQSSKLKNSIDKC